MFFKFHLNSFADSEKLRTVQKASKGPEALVRSSIMQETYLLVCYAELE